MSAKPTALRLVGARILQRNGFENRALTIRGGQIGSGPGAEINLTGYLVLPGIIDMHGDAFERHIQPRPKAAFSIEQGLISTDRDAAANGITTAWMAQSWSWEGGHRDPEFAEAFLEAVEAYRPRMQTDLRVQIRCETHTVDTLDRLLSAVEQHKVGYVVFNNHLDDMLHLIEAGSEEFAVWAKTAGRSADHHKALILEASKQSPQVPRYLCSLAAAFDRLGVLYGSHDDRDAETRETYAMIGAKICEFPLTRAVAKLANTVGDPVLMGAPNLVRGGSQAGNVAALELIEAGLCDALVSDYYYPALARSAFQLADMDVMSLGEAWNMISARPAEIMRMPDRGVIAEGRRADLVIVNEATRDVEATLVAGRLSHLTGPVASRFLSVPHDLAIAAE